jgi:hypothetical protein
MSLVPTAQDGAVLPDVKAMPFGWPAASLDPGFGRHRSAAVDTRPRMTKIKSH